MEDEGSIHHMDCKEDEAWPSMRHTYVHRRNYYPPVEVLRERYSWLGHLKSLPNWGFGFLQQNEGMQPAAESHNSKKLYLSKIHCEGNTIYQGTL